MSKSRGTTSRCAHPAPCLLVGLLPTVAFAAEGDVDYLYCDANGANWATGTKSVGEYTLVTSDDTSWGTDGTTTWYVVQGDVTFGTEDAYQRIGFIQNFCGPLHKLAACFGEGNAVRIAVKQLQPQFPFQLCDLLRKRRLAHMAPLCRLREIAFFCHSHHIAYVKKLHCALLGMLAARSVWSILNIGKIANQFLIFLINTPYGSSFKTAFCFVLFVFSRIIVFLMFYLCSSILPLFLVIVNITSMY